MWLILLSIILCGSTFSMFFGLYKMDLDKWENAKSAYERAGRPFEAPKPTFQKSLASLISLAIIVLLVGFESVTVVPAGHIGVQVTLGEVNQQTLSEGIHFVNPISRIKEVEVRLVTTQLKQASAGTKDLQQIHTDIVLNYRIDGSKAAHIYKEFGFDLQDRVILPALSESLKAVTAHYTSEELITKRDVVSGQVKEEVAGKLVKYGVEVGDISAATG